MFIRGYFFLYKGNVMTPDSGIIDNYLKREITLKFYLFLLIYEIFSNKEINIFLILTLNSVFFFFTRTPELSYRGEVLWKGQVLNDLGNN